MDTQKVAELLKDAVENMCDEGVSFYNGYSGRGMYGRKCIGLTGNMQQCMLVVGEALKGARDAADDSQVDFDRVVDLLMDFSQDSMGRDVIIYWSSIEPLDLPGDEGDTTQ